MYISIDRVSNFVTTVVKDRRARRGAEYVREARIKSLIETDMATAGVRLQFRATGPVKLTSTT